MQAALADFLADGHFRAHVRRMGTIYARPAGYGALIAAFGLAVPPPDELLAISERHTYRREGRWRILTPRYRPADTIVAHLEFALRHEGVDLGVLDALFQVLPPLALEDWVRHEPTGQYARRSWFLYQWLTGRRLDLPDAPRAPYAPVLDPRRHYAVAGETVTRHRVRDNLPGTPDFCPLVRRTETLHVLFGPDLAGEARAVVHRTAPGLIARAAAFLLLEDSKAPYGIEGERPPRDRIQRAALFGAGARTRIQAAHRPGRRGDRRDLSEPLYRRPLADNVRTSRIAATIRGRSPPRPLAQRL